MIHNCFDTIAYKLRCFRTILPHMGLFHDNELVQLLVVIDSTIPYTLVERYKELTYRPDSIDIEDKRSIQKRRVYWCHREDMDRMEQPIVIPR